MKKLLYLLLFVFGVSSFVFIEMKTKPVQEFLATLSPQLLEKAQLEFDDETKTQWHFFPGSMYEREGVSMKELDSDQREAAHDLLKAYLSKSGYQKTQTIMGLEEVLRSFSGDSVLRDPEKYHVSVYGDPTEDQLWAWSFEGHHVSLNFTVLGDEVVSSPRFFGSNPGRIPSGPREGERTLKIEEDLGFELINSMSIEQLEETIFQEESFKEIVTANLPEVNPLEPVGIGYESLDRKQQKTMIKIIDEYLSALPKGSAHKRRRQIEEEGFHKMRFGWVGSKELGSAHYYRIQGESFLLEFDNSQNEANHIHTVWRDFEGDFGRDLIREHYANSDHH